MLWFLDHFWTLALGYALCVLVPLPGLNRWIIDRWRGGWEWIKARL